jgi:hypothetical protein
VIATKPGPSDLVFAGTPLRAYVSCSRANVVQVFDPIARHAGRRDSDRRRRPKALAVSPDGSTVYAAILESGNATTIIARNLPTSSRCRPERCDDPDGPYGGQDPPPNVGAALEPPLNPYLVPESRPRAASSFGKMTRRNGWTTTGTTGPSSSPARKPSAPDACPDGTCRIVIS